MADQKCKSDFNALCISVSNARKELARLRKDIKIVKDMFLKRFKEIEVLLKYGDKEKDLGNSIGIGRKERENITKSEVNPKEQLLKGSHSAEKLTLMGQMHYNCIIGYIKTCFKEKNGIPRQGSVCPLSKAELLINGVEQFTNPSHALEGLEKFSHIWILFVFHKNSNSSVKAKVRPPRLDGKKVGVFASRSPHRPNPIGLTLACLDGIEGNKLLLSGIDILDGTPILDIKPYIPDYDSISNTCSHRKSYEECVYEKESSRTPSEQIMFPTKAKTTGLDGSVLPATTVCIHKLRSVNDQDNEANKFVLDKVSPSVLVSGWIRQPPITALLVNYSDKAREKLGKFYSKGDFPGRKKDSEGTYQLELFSNAKDVQQAIENILQEDPRSVYRRNHCADELYHFTIDRVNVSCVFAGNTVEVIDVNPI